MDNKSVRIPEVVLVSSDGRKMPVLGMGTSASPLEGSDETKTAILQAIEIGHRHFDTATLYLTEEPLGEAISEALSRGLIKSRDELFITSKLWCSDAHGDLVLPALKKSLRYNNIRFY
jgi:diketogulonate reductase-like aldo/keto reductase